MSQSGKPKPPTTPQEDRLEMLREFIIGNEDYKIRFDREDLRKREFLLKKMISRGWLGLGLAGMGYGNYRLLEFSYPGQKSLRMAALESFMLAGVSTWFFSYFRIKLEAQEYLRTKYLLRKKTEANLINQGSDSDHSTSH
jgi:hypothetical protein